MKTDATVEKRMTELGVGLKARLKIDEDARK
jgi:hypothetical protein